MERDIITMNEYGRVTIPTSTNVWMTEAELSALFGTIAPTLRTAIRAIYKSGVLKQHKAERYIRLPDGYGMDVYALSMVVALAFRINTPCARRVRKALLERLYGQKEKTSPVGVNEQTDARVLERGYVPTLTARRSDDAMLLRAFFSFQPLSLMRFSAFFCLLVTIAPFCFILRISVLCVTP